LTYRPHKFGNNITILTSPKLVSSPRNEIAELVPSETRNLTPHNGGWESNIYTTREVGSPMR
jgi:hypothetical protein